ncbi:hypothetical protein SteCoe_35460 [Stentor coeruleus]|uniref:USP domain-containing protein n=1 Tax=Stentor coeruleus TaxID=5963 RepID=A0A1R2ASC8_9CILI|nr:hypothetical protein SteCoe_35460 [Stentor coeruleus]
MFQEICAECDCGPCICSYQDLNSYIIGKAGNEFIGIKNLDYENNCFVSTALQALFNTTAFSMILCEECEVNDLCIICLLKKLNEEIIRSKAEKIPMIDFKEYRQNLIRICGEKNFAEGVEGDCFETIELIMTYMHFASKGVFFINEGIINQECEGDCHSHYVCYNLLAEQKSCNCPAKNSTTLSSSFIIRLNSNDFFRPVSSSLINTFTITLNKSLHMKYEKSDMKNYIGSFSEIIQKHLTYDQILDDICEYCKSTYRRSLFLKSSPKIMIFQLDWESKTPKLLNILQVLISLQGIISMSKIFKGDNPIEMGLKGLIVYLNNHYVYFGIGQDSLWYRVDDNLCQTIGLGRWYDVLLLILLTKSIPIGLFYEDSHVSDLSLYKIELLYLEKTVYTSEKNNSNEAGTLENEYKDSINPSSFLCKSTGEIDCINCSEKKQIGQVCSVCQFDPNENDWVCQKCNKINEGMILMCDYCDDVRFKIPINTLDCSCGMQLNFKYCKKCDALTKCQKCKKSICVVQSAFCVKCKKNCRDGYCDGCKTYDMLCRSCRD